ncbi:hypothetical protein MYAM1_003046 [Malassezia yamatoensis]|uniref:Major facilitator superfamily (MFS) profile domain-containing protein n=1 Tax=Malassezia yamatoensis TaxID=253288 RepID=A0AAJ5YZC9_9BASI|nr:hypothetical protein MYAM1_003046 [Malassezia yamatoensis]
MSHGRRYVSLAGSLLIALSAGSTYAFSTFAPQIQDALHLSSTQLNILGLAGNLGMYLSGPIWGHWIDQMGPRGAVSSGAVLVFVGYGMLSRAYKYEWHDMPVSVLALFMLMTGLGNSAGNNSAINVQAKSWGGSSRGTAMASVLSAFGLSALVYSTISHVFFADNVTGYLDMLAFGSLFSFLAGLSMLKILPPTQSESEQDTADRGRRRPSVDRDPDSPARPLLGSKSKRRHRSSSEVSSRVYAWLRDSAELQANTEDLDDPLDEPSVHNHNVTGFQLLREPDFFLLFAIVGLVSGAGLLLINNVGTITRALWEYQSRKSGEESWLEAWVFAGVQQSHKSIKAEKLAMIRMQSLQVSCISLGNASGRILIGLISDFLVDRFQKPSYRAFFLVPVTLMAVLSQSLAAWPNTITDVYRLLWVSSTTGLMYGMLFGIGPVLVFEWFGINSFSLNWGFMSLSPVLGGNVYNLLFGTVYDSNVRNGSHVHRCLKGEDCYRTVFIWTTVGCTVALLLSIALIIRRVKPARQRFTSMLRSIT